MFRLNADGTGYALLHSFSNSPDGATPFAGLAQGSDGALYGTTYYGGLSNLGTVFRINTNGLGYAILHSFTNTPDGASPRGSLIQGSDGGWYGTTFSGGASNFGTVFRLDPDGGGLTVLHSFSNSPDGATPFAGVIQGSDAALYGTTSAGGDFVIGTVFRLNTNGGDYSVLHSFTYLPDGASPQAALVQAGNGTLYGTTVIGGTNGFGTVFQINPNGSGYRTLRCFTNSPDGANAYAALTQGADGALYGTTAAGGTTNGGTLFRLNPDGSGYAVLHHFAWGSGGDGSAPFAGVTSRNGVFYGTTTSGGAIGLGTVYRLALLPELRIALLGPDARVTVTGVPAQSCQILASTNLASWFTATNLVLTNGTGQFTETTTNAPRRFYRALVP